MGGDNHLESNVGLESLIHTGVGRAHRAMAERRADQVPSLKNASLCQRNAHPKSMQQSTDRFNTAQHGTTWNSQNLKLLFVINILHLGTLVAYSGG